MLSDEMQRNWFPVQNDGCEGTPTTIPWRLAEQAYAKYVRSHGAAESLDGIAQRGGFLVSELDAFVPSWRESAGKARGEAPARGINDLPDQWREQARTEGPWGEDIDAAQRRARHECAADLEQGRRRHWKPLSERPTVVDGDADGRVVVAGANGRMTFEHHERVDSVFFNEQATWWARIRDVILQPEQTWREPEYLEIPSFLRRGDD